MNKHKKEHDGTEGTEGSGVIGVERTKGWWLRERRYCVWDLVIRNWSYSSFSRLMRAPILKYT